MMRDLQRDDERFRDPTPEPGQLTAFQRYRSGFDHLRGALKPAIAFEVWFTLVLVSFAPASGWLLNRLVVRSGQYAIADHDLLAFALSPAGVERPEPEKL